MSAIVGVWSVRPDSRTDKVTPSLVVKVRRGVCAKAWMPAIVMRATAAARPRRAATGLAARDEKARVLAFPVVTERKRKPGQIGSGLVGGFEVGLVPVAQAFDRRPQVAPVQLHVPRR